MLEKALACCHGEKKHQTDRMLTKALECCHSAKKNITMIVEKALECRHEACQPTMYFPFQVVRRLRTEFARAVAAVAKARADLRAALEIYQDAKYRRMAFDWTYDVGAAGRGG